MLSLIVVGGILTGTSFAILQDKTGSLTNVFKLQSIDTDIDEEFKGDLTKEPRVVNKDVSDALVRVRLTISNKEIFESNFGLEGIDSDPKSENWQCDNPDNKYDTLYYYTKVLKANDNDPGTDVDVTTPLFTKILKKTEEGTYMDFEFEPNSDGTFSPNDEDIEILKLLNDIEITIYQESIPVHAVITNENGNKEYVNAVDSDGDIIEDKAKQLWEYYDGNKK